jgi:hypothetical protein
MDDLGTHYPEVHDVMEARLIEEINSIQAPARTRPARPVERHRPARGRDRGARSAGGPL